MSSRDELNQPENPYAAPLSASFQIEDDPSAEDEPAQLRALVGSRADYYLQRWFPRPGERERSRFNWAAFLLTGFWIPYRKMYSVTFIFFGVIFVWTVLEEVLFLLILGEPEVPGQVDLFVNMAVAIICGMYGNRWYLSHARKAIARARGDGYEGEALLEELSRRGGTSLGASLGMMSLFIGAIVVYVGLVTIMFDV